MEIYTSYFYKIRFFSNYMIPVSTAIWDPKWFHNFEDQNHKWIDHNGVINGINYRALNPGPQHEDGCHGRDGCKFDYTTCKFQREYRDKIFQLNKDKVLKDFENLCNCIKIKLKLDRDPIIVLMVHEDDRNPCSERRTLQEFFNCTELEI